MIRRSLQDQISANKRASMIYASLLIILLGLFGGVVTGVYEPRYWWAGGLAAAALGLIVAMFANYSGSKLVLSVAGARDATRQQDRILDNVAEEMAIAAGIPKPRVMVIEDSSPNAFATGRDPQNGVVVFTTGIVDKLDRDELQAVMAHEIAHIRNYDIRLMTTLAIVAGLIPLIADFFWRSMWMGGGRRRSSDKDGAQAIFMVLAIVLMIIAPIFAKLLELAVSRKREYLADATAAELTRYPEALARALDKISHDPDPLEKANHATAHMFIVNPFKPFEARAKSLFSTHPPIQDRIRALKSLMGAYPARNLEDRAPRAADDFSDMPSIPDQTR